MNKKKINKTVLRIIKMLAKEEEQKQIQWQRKVIKEESIGLK